MKLKKEKTNTVGKILFVPRVEKGKGGGHLVRSVTYAGELRQAGIEAYIFIRDEILSDPAARQFPFLSTIDPEWIVSSEPEKEKWSFIILDNFQSSEADYVFWSNIAPVIAVDEGGSKRDAFDFLIDILPGPSGRSKANISGPSLLSLPKKRRAQFFQYSEINPFKILSVFGMEDASDMSLLLSMELASTENIIIDVVRKNPVSDEKTLPPNINIVRPFSGLRETLYQYDLVLTHFGITAFEALHAGVPVLITSPTRYHEQLARGTGFVTLGTKNRALKTLRNAEKNFSHFKKKFLEKIIAASKKICCEQKLDTVPRQSFIDIIRAFDVNISRTCPVCGASSLNHPIAARFYDRTYKRCNYCSMEYMLRLYPSSVQYTEDYFFGDYKKQYGKTYLEDFLHLLNMAKNRMLHIIEILRHTASAEPFRLLDIGCAYGPFLLAAKDEGFDAFGIDPSQDAVHYVTETLGIPAFQGFFPDIDLPKDVLKDGFDVISLWYVIEHFEDTRAALKKIAAWLKPGGVFAFSTPSGTGISALRNRNDFFDKSPADHWSVWNPRKTMNALKPYHLDVEKIAVTGHHPERFPFIHKNEGMMYNAVNRLSRCFGLGDTFEAYAVKET